MKTFKQYLKESFDSHYSFRDRGANSDKTVHKYAFDTKDNEDTMHVKIDHDGDMANIAFTDKYGQYSATNDKGSGAVKVFSTVHKIMQDHAAKYPHIKSYHFSGKSGSRSKLYDRMVQRAGGRSEDKGETKAYHIPADRLREKK